MGELMSRPLSFFDADDRLRSLSEAGDPLERLSTVIDFELFRPELEAVLARRDRGKGGRPPYGSVLMLQVLVWPTPCPLSDDQSEYQIKNRLSFMRFVGLELCDPVPDATWSTETRARVNGGNRGGFPPIRVVADLIPCSSGKRHSVGRDQSRSSSPQTP